ncbi:MAG: ATP-binding protein, partial [Bacteroidaceae bacterium]|nr:ATP-binding protein [Bacteroidaceae bacterium]
QTGENFRAYTLKELLEDHKAILKTILPKVRPWEYFQQYLHHGYYPFFLENRNFTENLLRAMNTMIEVDILFIKQIELKYLERIKKLLYLLAVSETPAPNVSRFAEEIGTSRATVMNYLKYLEEARLVNLIYREGEGFPKKPAAVTLHNPNLIYAIYSPEMQEQQIMECFFVNSLWRHHTVNRGKRDMLYRINNNTDICVCDRSKRVKSDPKTILARYNTEVGRGDNEIPLWLFGFLY